MMTEPQAGIRSAIEQFFHAMDTQDLDLMKQLVADDTDMVNIGTDEDEIWTGWEELQEATKEQFARLEFYEASIRDLRVNLIGGGEVACYAHLLDARIRSNGTETTWNGARFTGVLERREGRWVMVQTHVSLPESAQAAAG